MNSEVGDSKPKKTHNELAVDKLTTVAKEIVDQWAKEAAERTKPGPTFSQSGNLGFSLRAKNDDDAPVPVATITQDERPRGIVEWVGAGKGPNGDRLEGPVNRIRPAQPEAKKPSWEDKHIVLEDSLGLFHEFQARYILQDVLSGIVDNIRVRSSQDSALPKVDLKKGTLSLQCASSAEGDLWLIQHKAEINKRIQPAMTVIVNKRASDSHFKTAVAEDRLPG